MQLSVNDLLGRIVRQTHYDGSSGKTQLDISSLANGLYVVRVTSPPAPLQLERGVYLTGKLAIAR